MSVTSGEYVLAIPDYSHYARQRFDGIMQETSSESSNSSRKNAAIFNKVVMKLSGNVQWLAGLVFEKDLDDGGRSFRFRSHYNVVLKNPKMVQEAMSEVSTNVRAHAFLTPTNGIRTMTLLLGFEVIIFISLSQSLHPTTAIGQ